MRTLSGHSDCGRSRHQLPEISVELVWSSFGRSSAIVDAVNEVVDVLGDVGGVIADPLDVLGAEQQMRADADVARILHHVGQQLAEQRIVHRVDLRHRCARPPAPCRRRARRRRRAPPSAGRSASSAMWRMPGHQRLGVRFVGDRQGRAWRCSWRDRRCARGRSAMRSAPMMWRRSSAIGWRRAIIEMACSSISRSSASIALVRCTTVARRASGSRLLQRVERLAEQLLGEAAHLGDLLVEQRPALRRMT